MCITTGVKHGHKVHDETTNITRATSELLAYNIPLITFPEDTMTITLNIFVTYVIIINNLGNHLIVLKYLKCNNSISYLLSYLKAGSCLRLHISYNSYCQFTHAWLVTSVKLAPHSTTNSKTHSKNGSR